MKKGFPTDNPSGWSGLLVVQYVAPGEFFVLDGNPEVSILVGVGVEKFRGQELYHCAIKRVRSVSWVPLLACPAVLFITCLNAHWY